jgi:hypothetical protein
MRLAIQQTSVSPLMKGEMEEGGWNVSRNPNLPLNPLLHKEGDKTYNTMRIVL